MTSSLEIKSGSHWWEASVLTTTSALHRSARLLNAGPLLSISLNNNSAYCYRYVFRSLKASNNLHMDCPVMALNSIIAPTGLHPI